MLFRKIALLKRLPYLFQFFRMFIVVLAVIVPIFQSLGLTMAQIFQTQAIFGITIVALEIPTGGLHTLQPLVASDVPVTVPAG